MADAKNRSWRTWFNHAFAVEPPQKALSNEDRILVDRVVRFLVDRGLCAPATAALEASRPYTFLGSQFLVFLKPFAHLALPGRDYDSFTRLMGNRGSIDLILDGLAKVERDA